MYDINRQHVIEIVSSFWILEDGKSEESGDNSHRESESNFLLFIRTTKEQSFYLFKQN